MNNKIKSEDTPEFAEAIKSTSRATKNKVDKELELIDEINEYLEANFPEEEEIIEASDFEIYRRDFMSGNTIDTLYEVYYLEDSEDWGASLFFTTDKKLAKSYVKKYNRLLPKLKDHYKSRLPLEDDGFLKTQGPPTYDYVEHDADTYIHWIKIKDIIEAHYREIKLKL